MDRGQGALYIRLIDRERNRERERSSLGTHKHIIYISKAVLLDFARWLYIYWLYE